MVDTLLLVFTWVMAELIAPALSWCKETEAAQLLDPLWIITGIVGLVFGFLQWSLSRNVNNLDSDIKDMKDEIKDLQKEIREQRDKLISLSTSHEERIGCRTRKGDTP